MKTKTRQPLVETVNLRKSFLVGSQQVEVLRGIEIKIYPGEFVILFGPSGCGKSTMLHCLLGLEPPTKGRVLLEGRDFYLWNEDQRAAYRKQKVGMVYQQPLWIRALTVFENVAFPLRLLGWQEKAIEKRAMAMLELVGMADWGNYLPTELSSGQQQRVSLARALVIDPVLIAADEPTGNLDTVSGQELMETFLKLNQAGKTILMITHDLEYLKYATRIFHMIDGQIVRDYQPKKQGKIRVINGKRGGFGLAQANVRDPEFLVKLGL